MNSVIRIGTIAIGTVLLLTACDPGDLDLALDDFGSPLSESPERSVQAAGDTVVEVLATREAEDHLDEALETNDLDEVQQAVALRPDDPRYRIHEAVIRNANNSGAEETALGTAIVLNQVASPKWGECGDPTTFSAQADCLRWLKGTHRTVTEQYLEATKEAIYRTDDPTQRERLVNTYCYGITKDYVERYADDFPQETTEFNLFMADRSLCTDYVPPQRDDE